MRYQKMATSFIRENFQSAHLETGNYFSVKKSATSERRLSRFVLHENAQAWKLRVKVNYKDHFSALVGFRSSQKPLRSRKFFSRSNRSAERERLLT